MQEKGYSGDDSYALSKLASMMFTYDLAELMKSRSVTVNCLDPGTVNTKLLIAGWGACGINVKVSIQQYAQLVVFVIHCRLCRHAWPCSLRQVRLVHPVHLAYTMQACISIPVVLLDISNFQSFFEHNRG